MFKVKVHIDEAILFIAVYVLLIGLLFIPTLFLNVTVNQKSIQEMVDMTSQNAHTIYFDNTRVTEKEVLKTLNNLPLCTSVLYKVVKKERSKIVVETIYQAEELSKLVKAYGIKDVDSYNQFLDTVYFEPEPVCYSPIDLFESGKGNCYSFTLLTIFLLDRFFPEQKYEVLTDFYEDGDSHIYLKLYGETEDMICDLTKEKIFRLPE